MKILLLQQPKSFSDYPEWIKEVQERFGRLEVMVFTSDNRAVHHRWPNTVIKEIVVSDYSSVNICSFQGHCYCRRRPIALFDDYCGSRPPLLRIKATGC